MKTATIMAKRDEAKRARDEALVTVERLEKHYAKVNSYRVHTVLLEMKHEYELQNKKWHEYCKRLRPVQAPLLESEEAANG